MPNLKPRMQLEVYPIRTIKTKLKPFTIQRTNPLIGRRLFRWTKVRVGLSKYATRTLNVKSVRLNDGAVWIAADKLLGINADASIQLSENQMKPFAQCNSQKLLRRVLEASSFCGEFRKLLYGFWDVVREANYTDKTQCWAYRSHYWEN